MRHHPLFTWTVLAALLVFTAGCVGFESETELVTESESEQAPELLSGVYFGFMENDVEQWNEAARAGEPVPVSHPVKTYSIAWYGKEDRYLLLMNDKPYSFRCKHLDDNILLLMLGDVDGLPTENDRYLYIILKVLDNGLLQVLPSLCLKDHMEPLAAQRSITLGDHDALEGDAEALLPFVYALQDAAKGCADAGIFMAHESYLFASPEPDGLPVLNPTW